MYELKATGELKHPPRTVNSAALWLIQWI